MRVALAVEGTRGDVYPMLALAERLAARGHTAVICAPPDFEAESRARGIGFCAVGLEVRSYLAEKARVLAGGSALAMARESDRYFRLSLRRQFERLPAAAAGSDLVVAAGVQAAAASIAEHLGIPYRYVAYCPALYPSSRHGPATLPLQSLPPWANRMLWRALRSVYQRTVGPPLDAERAALGLPPLSDVFRYVAGERPLLAADPVLGEAPPDCPFPVEQVPCLHPLEGGPLPPKLEAFLGAGPPPVYLGFGSMPDPDPRVTTRELLEALRRLGVRALISKGWAGLGGEPLSDGVLELDPVDHASLFPRCAAVVHHGGAGTTTTAARAGVPQVVVPHVMDQFFWARRLHQLGVAPPALPRRKLTAERLASVLAAVLESELLAERARDLAREIRLALPCAPDPVDTLLAGGLTRG
jgi:vancomycin aglycone glucosyltransferase